MVAKEQEKITEQEVGRMYAIRRCEREERSSGYTAETIALFKDSKNAQMKNPALKDRVSKRIKTMQGNTANTTTRYADMRLNAEGI